MRSKAFFINGGAGRVICSIPAFEKYAEETDDNFIIVCEGGTDFYKGHPLLHNKVYDHWHKDLFVDKIKNRDIETPEPYRIWEYYNQKCNLSEAFDIAINKKGKRKLDKPTIYFNSDETIIGKNLIKEVTEKTEKENTIVFQPFGRGVQSHGNFIIDSSGRSFDFNNVLEFIKKLGKDFGIILMSEFPLNLEAEGINIPVAQPRDLNIRQWASIIKESSYFFGCDSVGQHIAYSCNKPGTVVVGSTFAENISYPDYEKFDIQDMGEGKRIYDPIRITMDEVCNRNNDGIMRMNDLIEDVIIKSIKTNFAKWHNIENNVNKVVKFEQIEKKNTFKLQTGTGIIEK
jgi:hypothetical protein